MYSECFIYKKPTHAKNIQLKSPTIQPNPGKLAEVEILGRVKVCVPYTTLSFFEGHPLHFGIKISA